MTPLATAYVLAGYSNTPWARYNASKLAHVPEVAARIDELQDKFAERSGIYAEYIQRKLLPLVEANHADLFDGDKLKPINGLPRALSAAISKVKFDPETGAVTEIALADKIQAGNVLLRSLGSIQEGPAEHRHTHLVVNWPPAEVAATASDQAAAPGDFAARIAALTRPKQVMIVSNSEPAAPTVEAITLAFEKLASAEPVLAAELIKLLRGADISTLRELFGAPKQQQPTADNSPAPPPPVLSDNNSAHLLCRFFSTRMIPAQPNAGHRQCQFAMTLIPRGTPAASSTTSSR
jgi:hypothetical protein